MVSEIGMGLGQGCSPICTNDMYDKELRSSQ